MDFKTLCNIIKYAFKFIGNWRTAHRLKTYMTIQEWFEKRKEAQIQRRQMESRVDTEDFAADLWTKCVHCEAQITKYVCLSKMQLSF